jgi:hypothetical protein
MANWFLSLFGTAGSSQASAQTEIPNDLTLSIGVNPFVGRWQSANTLGMGVFSQVDFSADGRFSTVMQTPNGPMTRMGVYKIINANTIWFGFVPDTHIQFLPGSNGQIVAYGVHGFPQETNFYQFLDARTMVMSSSIMRTASTTYTKVA